MADTTTVVLLDCGHYVMSSSSTGTLHDLCFRHGEENPWRKVVHLADLRIPQETCHHEFEGGNTCRWCGLATAFTPEQEAVIERVSAAVRAASQPPTAPRSTDEGGYAPSDQGGTPA